MWEDESCSFISSWLKEIFFSDMWSSYKVWWYSLEDVKQLIINLRPKECIVSVIKSSIQLHRRKGFFMYFLLFHLLQFDLDSIWTFIFGVPASCGTVTSSIHSVCTEAAFLLLGMLRSMLNSVSIKNSVCISVYCIVRVSTWSKAKLERSRLCYSIMTKLAVS